MFFLACEVGGSKFIDSKDSNVQLQIIESNVKIYQTVFPYLAERKIPFIFSSSYLQFLVRECVLRVLAHLLIVCPISTLQQTSYGSVKRLGEAWIACTLSHEFYSIRYVHLS